MKILLTAGAVLTVWAMTASTGWASWGWPPPGYSTTGVKASDGSHYVGLCQKTFRQWKAERKARRQAAAVPVAMPVVPAAEQVPAPRVIDR